MCRKPLIERRAKEWLRAAPIISLVGFAEDGTAYEEHATMEDAMLRIDATTEPAAVYLVYDVWEAGGKP